MSGERKLFNDLVSGDTHRLAIASVLSPRSADCRANALRFSEFYDQFIPSCLACSHHSFFVSFSFAIARNDHEAIRALIMELQAHGERAALPAVTLAIQNSGNHTSSFSNYNRRAVAASRGGKEGNAALACDLEGDHYPDYNSTDLNGCIKEALIRYDGVRVDTLELLGVLLPELFQTLACDSIVELLREGRRELASHLVSFCSEGFGFNKLGEQVLRLTGQKLDSFIRASVSKQPLGNRSVRPLHMAAINPNPTYLREMLDAAPDTLRLADADRFTALHYAATCASSAPLKLLLGRGLMPSEAGSDGRTALMWAAQTGRVSNVIELVRAVWPSDPALASLGDKKEITAALTPVTVPEVVQSKKLSLKSKARTKQLSRKSSGAKAPRKQLTLNPDAVETVMPESVAEEMQSDEAMSFGVDDGEENGQRDNAPDPTALKQSLLNAKDKKGLTALHYAASRGHIPVLLALLHLGADVNVKAGAAKDSVLPLHLAAQQGHLKAIEALASGGAKLDAVDKKKRSALLHAVKNGQTHIVAFLLGQGLNPNNADSSANSALAYAVAYGWDDCVTLLLAQGASADACNSWKLSPLALALQKGRFACASILLAVPEVSINFRDASGRTLLVNACAGAASQNPCPIIQRLRERKDLDVCLADATNNTALHVLASTSVLGAAGSVCDDILSAAGMLLEAKADLLARNNDCQQPVMLACAAGNTSLTKFLVERNAQLGDVDARGQNVLHHLLARPHAVADVLTVVRGAAGRDNLSLLAAQADDEGLTPVHIFLRSLCSANFSDHAATHISLLVSEDMLPHLSTTVIKLKRFRGPDAERAREEDRAAGKKVVEWSSVGGYNALHFVATFNDARLHRAVLTALPGSLVRELVNAKTCRGVHPLTLGLANGRDEGFISALTALGAEPKQARDALHTAVTRRDAKVCAALISAGAPLDARDDHERTPLHLAVIAGDKPLVALLLASHCDVLASDKWGRTALHYAVDASALGSDASFEMEASLLAAGANVNVRDCYGRTPLHYAFLKMTQLDTKLPKSARETHFPSEPILDNIQSNSYKRARQPNSIFAPVAVPKEADPIETVSSLCGVKGIDTTAPDLDGRTPMHFCAVVGATICFLYLLKRAHGALEAVDRDGNTPLALALLQNNPNFAIMLIQKVNTSHLCYETELAVTRGHPCWLQYTLSPAMLIPTQKRYVL